MDQRDAAGALLVAAGVLFTPRGPAGPPGPAGPRGRPGAQGPAGPAGASGVDVDTVFFGRDIVAGAPWDQLALPWDASPPSTDWLWVPLPAGDSVLELVSGYCVITAGPPPEPLDPTSVFKFSVELYDGYAQLQETAWTSTLAAGQQHVQELPAAAMSSDPTDPATVRVASLRVAMLAGPLQSGIWKLRLKIRAL